MLRDYAHCDLLIWFFPFRLFCESPRANTSSKLYRRKWRAITDKSNKSSGLFIAWSNYRSFYGPINCILFWENKKSNKPDTRVRLRLPCLENMKNWRTKKSFKIPDANTRNFMCRARLANLMRRFFSMFTSGTVEVFIIPITHFSYATHNIKHVGVD